MAAVGMYMSVVVSVIFGWVLLLAVTFAVPDTQGTLDAVGDAVVYIWAESMGQNWAEMLLFICCVAQFFCLTASVTSASRMMFAFSRDRRGARPPALAEGRREPRAAQRGVGDRLPLLGADDPDLLERLRRLPRRDLDRRDRALHRVHPPGDPALSDGRRVRAGRLEPRQALQVDRPDRDRLGRRSSRSSSSRRTHRPGSR